MKTPVNVLYFHHSFSIPALVGVPSLRCVGVSYFGRGSMIFGEIFQRPRSGEKRLTGRSDGKANGTG